MFVEFQENYSDREREERISYASFSKKERKRIANERARRLIEKGKGIELILGIEPVALAAKIFHENGFSGLLND